jgi:hypothetical protein
MPLLPDLFAPHSFQTGWPQYSRRAITLASFLPFSKETTALGNLTFGQHGD